MGQENEQVISGLVTSIKSDPSRLLFYVEDAVVIDESSSAQIVATAIKTANADEKLAKDITNTAIGIVPELRNEIEKAAKVAMEEARAQKERYDKIEELQLAGVKPQIEEIRRALGTNGDSLHKEEVRSALPAHPLLLEPTINIPNDSIFK